MANLKQDLLNNLGNDKYYLELELARLAGNPNINYKEKIDEMGEILKEISLIDLSTQLVGKYFQEPAVNTPVENKEVAPQAGGQPLNQQGATVPHAGQTHAE